ncbi:uncharacterized protein LOC135845470 [Planococcus citri]|uniref:uncharacterized protein LOC135845470 n=1 Tax=Planococcus citri TaxID=170843 RepID=UPI0031F8B26A
MGGNDYVELTISKSCVPMNPNQRLVSLKKLRIALVCRLADHYIYLGKPTSYHIAQIEAATTHRETVKMFLSPSTYTVPWYWEPHALFVNTMIMLAGFDPDHLLIVEFINTDDPKVKKTMTLYSSKNREFLENIPSDFDEFCDKLAEICTETASSQPQPNEPSPMVALFNYSASNHKVLNLIEEGTDVKSALMSLLRELEVIKDNKLCKVQVFDPYKIFPNYEFRRRHIVYRKLVTDFEQELENFPVTIAESEKCSNIINQTVAFDNDFREIVKQFATKYLPKLDENDPRVIHLSRFR